MTKIEIWPGHAFYKALWPGLLSLLWPGLGHIYVGYWYLGIAIFLVEQSLEILLLIITNVLPPQPVTVAVWLLAFVALRIAIGFDAIRRMRLGKRNEVRPWHRSTWFAAAILVTCNFALYSTGITRSWNAWPGIFVTSDVNAPTLMRGDRVLTSKPPTAPFDYGQMVTFSNPRDRGIEYMGRIVGLPGDRVRLVNGILYLNDKPVPRQLRELAPPFRGHYWSGTLRQYEETLPNGRSYMAIHDTKFGPKDIGSTVVPAGHVFVFPDSRLYSLSYIPGTVPFENIRAEMKLMIWPASGDYGRILSPVR